MAKTYNRLEIDVNKKPNSIGIRPVQNDTKSRYLDVCLYENGVAINLTGEQVRITFRKADGSTFFNQGEVTDATAGRCQFALTNEILSEAKAVEAQISVWNAGGEVLSTQVFEIYVSAAIPWTDAVESENEYGVLVVLFQEIQGALDTMHKIATTFGEPGDKAAEYGVDTFWGILEFLAQRGDMESALQNKITAYLNSTVGTSDFLPLDTLIRAIIGDKKAFETPGAFTFTVPPGVARLQIIAAGAGGGGGGGGTGTYYYYGAGGGGGGACIKTIIETTPGTVFSGTIGAGGAGGAAGSIGLQGETGGSTVINSIVTLPGGTGGVGGRNSVAVGGTAGGTGGGDGGSGTTKETTPTSYSQPGLLGQGGVTPESTRAGGGGGGSYGNGGDGITESAAAAINGTKGGGGGGSAYNRGAGGNGGNGIVEFRWGGFII